MTNPAVGAGTDEEPLEPGWVGSALSPADPAAPLSISDWHTDTQIPVFVPPPVEPPTPPDRPVRAVGMPPPQPPVPAPGGPPARDPIAGLRWAPPPDVFRPAAPATAPRVPGAEEPFGRPGEPEPVADPGSAAPFEEPDDRTMPASRLRPGWTLITSADLEIALTGTEVLLGRQPGTDPNHPAAQPLVLPDPTRTVSKVHALLRLVDGVWLVRDLGSTNGITLVAADGRERTLARDLEAPVTGRFFLGDAEFELREGPPHP